MSLHDKHDETSPRQAGQLPTLLTQAEAAQLLRKPPRWLERKRCEGGGPPFRYIGRTPVYEEARLFQWIEEQPLIEHSTRLLSLQGKKK